LTYTGLYVKNYVLRRGSEGYKEWDVKKYAIAGTNKKSQRTKWRIEIM